MKNWLYQKKLFFKIFLLIIFLLSSFTFSTGTNAVDGRGITIVDPSGMMLTEEEILAIELDSQQTSWLDTAWKMLKKSGSAALSSSLRSALNKIAYETATYIGSGGRGQKPLFITEGWGEYLGNIGDEAAGEFIEKLGRDPGFFGEFNLCQPNLDVRIKIGLGLKEQYKPRKPTCTFTEMKGNWENELSRIDFLYRFKSMFDPAGNDLLQAFTMQANIIGKVDVKKKLAEKDLDINKGWNDIRNLAGDRLGPPGQAARDLDFSYGIQKENIGNFTGDALVDASNVFLNQLAITAFQTAMRKLGEGKGHSTQPFDWSSLTDFNAGPSYGGIAGTKDRLNKVIEPKFSVRGDYDILAELTMCPEPTKAGPTECVITDKFRQAVSDRLTVAEAMEQGYLNRDMVFGFKNNGIEPRYNEGLPYRSMIILRKFRILPVSWEVAAQSIKEYSSVSYSLQEMVDCFEMGDDYDNFYEPWCEGLVDPNWVLKAPLNYCRREGPGPEIKFSNVTGKGEDSQLTISRDDTYCADEQACIDENDDGSCNIFGYCTEERRKWTFGSDSCKPIYNTCQTFMASDGSKISYLENTLDAGDCSSSNAGCAEYFVSTPPVGGYDSATNNVNWSTAPGDPALYFDRDASECSDENEGCGQFIRTKEGLGTNLLPNSSFEESDGSGNFDYWGTFGTESNDSLDGYLSLQLASGPTSKSIFVGPTAYSTAGETFTLSVYAKDCGSDTVMELGNGGNAIISYATTTIGTSDEWSVYRVSNSFPLNYFYNDIEILFDVPSASACLIDSIKLERGTTPTRYSAYMDTGVIYSKMIPEYLYEDCYQNAGSGNYQLRATRPLECDTYSRLCIESEVGCNLFTSTKDKISVPAKVSAQDYCPDVCVGYDAFIQSKSAFDSLQDQYFIPNTAQSCSAQYAGCDEFTNLDKAEEGGESREYYTNLKQCVKPAESTNGCGEYYTWEGSKETGYQLKVFSLENNSAGFEPNVTSNDSAECNEIVYYASSTSPLYNPDCREYYAKSGQVYYHLDSRVISCTDNCYPYRRTEDNVVKDSNGVDYSSAQCGTNIAGGTGLPGLGEDYGFDTDNNYCVKCINGGTWYPQHNACVYSAVPEEGETCVANQAGCREYGGNSGSNVKTIINNDFEGATQGWIADGALTTDVSNESLMVGGNSLFVSGASYQVSNELGYRVQEGDAYVINFLAKGNGNIVSLDFSFENSVGSSSSFSQPVVLNANEWGIYEINLLELDHEIDSGEKIVIAGTNDFYIDDIRLTNIRDRYYLVKNSWVMPEVNGRDICNWDILADAPSPQYSLFCEQYTDKENEAYSLRGFTNLCQESAVGCEVMIDTQNSDNFDAEVLPGGAVIPQVSIPADNYVYAVFNEEKLCDSQNEGCQRMGKSTSYEGQILTQDFYIKNNPDEYDTTLCAETETECREWSTNEGLSYFKEPGDQVCEWRQGNPVGASVGKIDFWEWYKKKVKKCDDDSDGYIDPMTENSVCNDENDCSNNPCILDENDRVCPTSQVKTFGYGGSGKLVEQPTVSGTDYWSGTCPAVDSGCTEYIDPISSFSVNLLFNGGFNQDVDVNSVADGWEEGIGNNEQSIYLEPSTLYIFSVEGDNNITLNTFPASKYELRENDNLIMSNNGAFLLNPGAGERQSVRFFTTSPNPTEAILTVNAAGTNAVSNPSIVSVRKAAIDYQIDIGVDRESCNGQVSFKDGCILFNERVGPFSSFNFDAKDLNLDADRTSDTAVTTAPLTGLSVADNNANVLLKVRPDRECNEWLACKSYIKDESDNAVCYDIGLCDALDDNGNCKNFVSSEFVAQPQIHSPGSKEVSDKTGYSKFAYSGTTGSFRESNDYFPFGDMEQVGNVLFITNGNFETYSSDGYPISWSNTAGTVWDKQNYKIINNPVEAQNEGIGRNPEGNGFLRLGPGFTLESGYIDVSANAEYVLSAFLNTVKMNEGGVRIDINLYNSSGASAATVACPNSTLTYEKGMEWSSVSIVFCTGLNVSKVKLTLGSNGNPNGNFYFDDIKIKPALNSTLGVYTSQECRLYPDSDSLSCEYTEDSGAKKKGWSGYCLEHDIYPGNKDACLLWWPIDNVKGEGDIDKDNYGGYLGKTPVYYCDNVGANFETVEVKKEVHLGTTVSKSRWWGLVSSASSNYLGSDACPSEYGEVANAINSGYWLRKTVHTKSGSFGFSKKTTINYYCTPIGSPISSGFGHNWYLYNGNLVNIKGADNGGHNEYEFGVKLFDFSSGTFFETDSHQIKCGDLHKVVTEDGQNKAWGGRVYSGSDFTVQGLDYVFSADEAPFGSMVIPEPIHNPYEWDGDSRGGNQAIPLLPASSDKVRAGSPYGCTGVACPDLGYCSVSGDLCYYVPQLPVTAIDGNYYPVCGTKTEEACYVVWDQDFLPCPGGEICDVTAFNIDSVGILPEENEKRLFAKSYGNWYWATSQGVCVGGTSGAGLPCTPLNSQCPNGDCSPVCSATIAGVSQPLGVDSLVSFTTPTCTTVASPSGFCETSFNYEDNAGNILTSVAAFNSVNQCSSSTAICGATGSDCIDDYCCPVAGTASEAAFTAQTGETCATQPGECCLAGDPERLSCETYYQGLVTTPVTSICAETLDVCSNNSDCEAVASCEYGECVGGDFSGNTCTQAQICVGGVCDYQEGDSGRYELGVPTWDWDVPTNACTTIYPTRPTLFSAINNDYCAIAPDVEIPNILVNGVTGSDVEVKQGQIANITFTSFVERNQEPLVGYSIYWDGGLGLDSTVISGIRMNSKPDPANPHSVYHLYSYVDLFQKAKNSSAVNCGADCQADGYCTLYDGAYCRVKPLIQIKDNWGWCNGGEGIGGGLNGMCPTTAIDMAAFNNYIVVTAERAD